MGTVGLVRQPTSTHLAQLEAKGRPKTFELTHAVHGLLRVLRAGRCRSVRPQLLVRSVWAHAGILFAPYVQCCAGEFLTYVLDRLTLELGDRGGRVVHDLFAVEIEYRTRCERCRHVSTRRERNHDLHVALPEDETQPAGGLLDLLGAQLGRHQEERVEGYHCERCKRARVASRSSHLVAHPPVLLLTLKRTRYNVKTRRAHKDYRAVAFPSSFPASRLPLSADGEQGGEGGGSDGDGGGGGGAGGGAGGVGVEGEYRLAAVIVHSSATDRLTGRASAENGHYFTLCRDDAASHGGGWLEKNDARLRMATEAEVLRNERGCFVLAYELVVPSSANAGSLSPSLHPRKPPPLPPPLMPLPEQRHASLAPSSRRSGASSRSGSSVRADAAAGAAAAEGKGGGATASPSRPTRAAAQPMRAPMAVVREGKPRRRRTREASEQPPGPGAKDAELVQPPRTRSRSAQ